jgi:hypothetical protein
MTAPVAFVSHFRVKEGMLEPCRRYMEEGSRMLEADKPRTSVFLPFLSEDGTELSIVHVFADADAMDVHVEGAGERAQQAYEFVEPTGWEIYGRPSEAVSETMRQGAEAAGVPVTFQPESVAGFLRVRDD